MSVIDSIDFSIFDNEINFYFINIRKRFFYYYYSVNNLVKRLVDAYFIILVINL